MGKLMAMYWFKHDVEARNDDKIINLRIDLGAAGYGIYFMILELLATSENFKLSDNYKAIAYKIGSNEELVEKVVLNYGLFEFDNDFKFFYSPRLKKHMDDVVATSEKRAVAGRVSAAKRAGKNETADVWKVPTEDEVKEYCKKNNIDVSVGKRWYDYNNIIGFYDEDNKPVIKYWRASLKRWVQKLKRDGDY
ncbi:MAG: DUF4373 domain-containing protein [Bacteroidales bacterium]|nr:DUF4373 domain-containing protein [Bacteroidales bacterium]